MSTFKNLIESGVRKENSPSTRRVIVLSNYVALTLAAANVLIFFIIPGNHNIYGFLEMLLAIFIFLVPILLNRMDLTIASRLYECWLRGQNFQGSYLFKNNIEAIAATSANPRLLAMIKKYC